MASLSGHRVAIKFMRHSSIVYTCNIERDGLALVGYFGAAPEDGSTSHDAWLFRLRRRSSNQQPIFFFFFLNRITMK